MEAAPVEGMPANKITLDPRAECVLLPVSPCIGGHSSRAAFEVNGSMVPIHLALIKSVGKPSAEGGHAVSEICSKSFSRRSVNQRRV